VASIQIFSACRIQRPRLDPRLTVILTCGDPALMAHIKFIADSNRIRLEKEDW